MTKQVPSIGESVRTRRIAVELSQRGLAHAARTTPAAISHIERGVRKPSADLLARIAFGLGCSTDDLLSGVVGDVDEHPRIRQVVAVMKSFPPPLQKEVLDFCGYLKHRNRRRRS